MSVLKNKRSPSPFDVLDHALRMRKEITSALLIDFAYHPKQFEMPKNLDGKSDEEKAKIMEKELKRMEKQESLNGWFLEKSRNAIIDSLMCMIKNIQLANAIFITNLPEYHERRIYQNRAIGYCGVLSQELQYVIETLPVDSNKYTRFAKMIREQINLLKGWRKSDNKQKKKLEEKGENVNG